MSRDKKWSSNDKNQLLVENFRKFIKEGDFSSDPKEDLQEIWPFSSKKKEKPESIDDMSARIDSEIGAEKAKAAEDLWSRLNKRSAGSVKQFWKGWMKDDNAAMAEAGKRILLFFKHDPSDMDSLQNHPDGKKLLDAFNDIDMVALIKRERRASKARTEKEFDDQSRRRRQQAKDDEEASWARVRDGGKGGGVAKSGPVAQMAKKGSEELSKRFG